MLHPTDRWVQFQNLVLNSEPEHAPRIDLKGIIPLLVQLVKSNDAQQMKENDTASMRIAEAKYSADKKALFLLLQYADMNTTDPVFYNMETQNLRTEHKLEGEGIAVSAHAVLSLVPTVKDGIEYQFLLEEIPGLGRSRVQPFLKAMIKSATTNQLIFVDESDNDKKKNYRPSAELLASASQSMVDELQGASVEGIELVRHVEKGKGNMDEAGYFVEVTETVKMAVLNKYPGEQMIRKLRKSAQANNYDNVKVRYKRPEGKRKTATLGATDTDLRDSLVSRTEQVTSPAPLPQCSSEIDDQFIANIFALLD